MASLTNFSGGKISYSRSINFNRISHRRPFSLPVSTRKRSDKRRSSSSSSAMALSNLSNSPANYPPSVSERCRFDEKPAEIKIDEWMQGSVSDIVQNLKQAPLLVHVHSTIDGRGNSVPEFRTEKAVQENWPNLRRKWRNGEIKSPDGLIFVEELSGDEEETHSGNEAEEGMMTRAWGIVVQGKGVECGAPACYLLKTSRVGAGCGLGLFCTHFCLTKVTDFRETALKQLQNCWLLE